VSLRKYYHNDNKISESHSRWRVSLHWRLSILLDLDPRLSPRSSWHTIKTFRASHRRRGIASARRETQSWREEGPGISSIVLCIVSPRAVPYYGAKLGRRGRRKAGSIPGTMGHIARYAQRIIQGRPLFCPLLVFYDGRSGNRYFKPGKNGESE
jgi:hypothetical protein